MNDQKIKTINDVIQFLSASERIEFKVTNKQESYDWIFSTLHRFNYKILKKKDRSIIRTYIQEITNYSNSQITRLINKFTQTGVIKTIRVKRNSFPTIYTLEDIKLLAETDKLHNNPNGNVIKKIFINMNESFNDPRFNNLKNISIAHIYNIRNSITYHQINTTYTRTKPTIAPKIGDRRKPFPNGNPGFIRVDTVHQGDNGKEKGVYHINTVDEVTQFQFIGATPYISEKYLLPILKKLIDFYPFKIIEFHSDNGSEFINHVVCDLLNKLLIKLTKSRARKTNDNALVEGKNASTIRKWIGYGFLGKEKASQLNNFYSLFNEYLNFHKPCAFAESKSDEKGKIRKYYPFENYMTPFQKLKSLPDYGAFLKNSVSKISLEKIASRYTDNDIATMLHVKLSKLLKEENINLDYVNSLKAVS
jgi:hypothetical protein